jgi:nicotinamide-nucleotide adenylyltransferase
MQQSIAPHVLRHYWRVQQRLARLQPEAAPQAIVSPGSERPRTACILFPGSFNPPTLAHLAMLRQAQAWARQRHGGHWQVYAALSQHIVDKEQVARMTLLDRVVLLERLLTGQAGVLLFNCGLYVQQAQGIHTAFPRVRQLYFLLGFDKIGQIFDARYYPDRDAALHTLFAVARLLVAPRGADSEDHLKTMLARPENRPFARYVHALPLDARYRQMSSTSARQGMHLHNLPAEVADFIQRTRPYDSDTEPDVYARRTHALQALLTTGHAGGTSGNWRQSERYRPQSGDNG